MLLFKKRDTKPRDKEQYTFTIFFSKYKNKMGLELLIGTVIGLVWIESFWARNQQVFFLILCLFNIGIGNEIFIAIFRYNVQNKIGIHVY